MSPNNNLAGPMVDSGKLKISVTTLLGNFPVSDARVLITDTNTGIIVEELVTDASGQTPTIDLAAPPVDFSLEPEYEIRPYAEYNVTVNAEDFDIANVDGVQIFSASTALQNVKLKVLKPESILIIPHTLWFPFPPKIRETSVKELPFPSGLVVLPEPVIPEFVIVHLGVPDDTTAENVWIPYKDYIKNVASCEIYSTWSRETITANVLAINSFVLNRVYTEWYRGKGYDFTITNTTAFDQAFTFGRNIFENISVIVDEVFDTYCTKPLIQQPYLTQFCDGVRTICSGWAMEQWGSKALGDEGLDSLSILRTYYGAELYLEKAEKVEGVPISYPGFTLQIGSTGPAVRTIQTQLNAISNNFPAIKKIRVDGQFGADTEEAVKTFQEVFNLPVTGVVDFATWYEISNIFVAVTKIAEPF